MRKVLLGVILELFIYSFSISGAFRDLGNGARAISLGLPYIAISDNPYGIFYNPAGVGQMKRLSLASTYSRLYPSVRDENLYYLAFGGVIPFFSVFNFGVGASLFKTGMWGENQFIITVAKEFKRGLSFGGNVKFLRWSSAAPEGEGAYSYFGFTFDFGAILVWRNFIKDSELRIGFSLGNITQPSIAMNRSKDARLPLEISTGFVYVSNSFNYLIGIGALKSGDNIKVDLGFEMLAFSSKVLNGDFEFILRASVGTNVGVDKQSSLNPGFGLKYQKFRIDYVYVYNFELADAGGSHKFSFEFNF